MIDFYYEIFKDRIFTFVFMFAYTKDFPQAIKDYETFLWKKYPQKIILKLVGDRYKLTGTERTMLYRGVTTFDKAAKRRLQLTDENQLKSKILHVDAFNQFLTIGNYLRGQVVFLSFDGLLRDASEIHGKDLEKFLPMRSVELVISYLIKTEIAGLKLYFDNQVSGYESFIMNLRKAQPDFILQPEIIISDQVDKDLSTITDGIVCTSDSVIIERTPLKIFDLAQKTIKYHFFPNFIDLIKIASDSMV
jgi:hypothetical protein